MKTNYQLLLNSTIKSLENRNITPTLLLHSCCAPCSSYVLEYLSQYFEITVFYYNPNIYPPQEYDKRVAEQKGLIQRLEAKHKISLIEGDYKPEVFFDMAKGLEDKPEGGERCFQCYELRLREAAIIAKEKHFEYFTTTLSVSPYKNSEKLNCIGRKLEEEFKVKYLYSDFKKNNGYKRSIELSHIYNLYRQNYCGCVYSKAQEEQKKAEQE